MKLKINCNFGLCEKDSNHYFTRLSSHRMFFSPIKRDTANLSPICPGFSIESKGTLDVLILRNVVPNSETVFRYALAADGIELPKNNTYDGVIRTPIKRIVATSTTHLAFLEELDALETLVGFPETDYISSPKARKRISEGTLIDVGKSQQLNVERILELNPDLL